jgi:LuxR family maltose regulon positive regulatory protein
MSSPDVSTPEVIETKLRVPSPRPEQVPRPGLLAMLEGGLGCRVTLVSAPTGYGKTILLSQWLRTRGADGAFAWVSLDEQDDDPIRLWRHIVESLGRGSLGEEFGAAVLGALSVAGAGVSGAVLPMLVNELGEVPQRVLLVLDDYQFASGEGCHEAMDFFLEHLPENVHLVLSTRSDPPLHLGRLRARGELNEIRTEHLAFTGEEVGSLLNDRLQLHVGPEDLSVLLDRTEGWPAGIYLAVLFLEGKDDVPGSIASFGGSNRYILDLLGEEVLAGLPEKDRAFMLQTSVLSRMTGPLCDAVVGGEGSGELLDRLARSNLFVVPLDDHGGWYRYHHLFAELLTYELKGSRPDLLPILHGRASAWFDREGMFDSAARHAVAAENYVRAGAKTLLDETRGIGEADPDAGILPSPRSGRSSRAGKRRPKESALNGDLTERELAVLRLFDGELSHRQIGENLYVSLNTVKTHVRSIYRKLGVSSRKEAINQARERKII